MENLAKLNGVKTLSKNEQKSINGGTLAYYNNNCSQDSCDPSLPVSESCDGARGRCINCNNMGDYKCVYK